MKSDLKYEKSNIELRRGRVLELISKGYSQTEIAKALNVSDSLISLDIQYIREQSKKELETHITDKLPYEYKRATAGINDVLRRASELYDNAPDNKTKIEIMKLQVDLYRSIMSLATDGSIVERAMKMIKVISPFPGERIPTEGEIDGDNDKDKEEDSEIKTEDEDIPTEEEAEEEETEEHE